MPIRIDPRLPVIIGVGQVLQRDTSFEDAREPALLMADAVRSACTDAGLASVPAPDSIRTVELYTCLYPDPGRAVAAHLGVEVRESATTSLGGNSPQSLLNLTAAEIQRGRIDLAFLSGGECWRTRTRARREGVDLGWGDRSSTLGVDRVIGSRVAMTDKAEEARGIGLATQVYAMFESAVRARSDQSPQEHQSVVGNLWAEFSAVAGGNPFAWSRQPKTAEQITAVTASNRLIGLPYTKSMNSNNDVDMAAALVVCSTATASALGVPEDRWVFPHAGVDCRDVPLLSSRWELGRCPAVRFGAEALFAVAGIGRDDVEFYDLYSCFPSAVQVGATEIGIADGRGLTRTGGLSFAGGPWNNYSMHAVATVVDDLRRSPGSFGLVWANGEYLTKHAFGLYSTSPPCGYRSASAQERIDAGPTRPAATEPLSGSGTIDSYTVMHDRAGAPDEAFASCLDRDGRRMFARSTSGDVIAALTEREGVGTKVTVDAEGCLRTV